MQKPARIPVIMYHTVGRPVENWIWDLLTTPVDLFEKQLKMFRSHGYRSLSLTEFRERQGQSTVGDRREVVLTFDDGYLDNWVFAYPLLKREGFCGTVYVNPDFIDPSETPRPNLEDVWAGRCSMDDLQVHGFLNRAELRILNESGVLVVGSHSMTHTWYPTGPEVTDFHRPNLETPWLGWNAKPERKFAYLTEFQGEFVPYGWPIHQSGRALGIRKYFPNDEICSAATECVTNNGGAAFFQKDDWLTCIQASMAGLDEGRYETDVEMMERFRDEIFESRRILEEIVGTPVTHFCWPGGAYTEENWPLAEEAGYETICVARKDKGRWLSEDGHLVRRIGSHDFVSLKGRRYRNSDAYLLILACEVELGRHWKRWPLRLMKLVSAFKQGFKTT